MIMAELQTPHPTIAGEADDFAITTSETFHEYVLRFEHEIFIGDICIMVLTVIANIVAIFYICSSQNARTTHNITVVSICVSNLIISTFVIPTYFAVTKYDAMKESVPPFLCKLHRYVWYWLKTVNIYSIVAMVTDRYVKVMNPYKRGYMSGRCLFFLNFVWFFGAAYNIWEIVLNTSAHILLTVDGRNVTMRKCIVSSHFAYLKTGFLVADFLCIYIFPFVLIGSLNICMFVKVCLYPDPQRSVKGKSRIAMGLLLTVLFYVCQLPLEIAHSLSFFRNDHSRATLSLLQLLESLSFSNGLLHVAAYVICSRELNVMLRRPQREPTATPQILLRSCSHDDNTMQMIPV